MAFAFFRRRQKMVIIIMVVLMVAFLIGFRGFEIIFDRKIKKQSIGETRHGSIRYADIYSAEHDLNILANIGLARPMGQSYSYVPGSIEFQMITSRNNDPARTYAMLVQEAQSAKLIINDDDVNSFLASMDIASTLRDSADWLKAMLQAQRITEEQFRNIVKRWLAVQRLYANNVINLPPSEQIIMVVARDYLEQMKLRILKFDAEDYLEQVDETHNHTAGAGDLRQVRLDAKGAVLRRQPLRPGVPCARRRAGKLHVHAPAGIRSGIQTRP